jgi:2-methylcitrate dehydratase PrpD
MTRLSVYMSEAKGRELPPDVLEKAKHHILDTFAAMISGCQLPGGRAAIQFARAYVGSKIATVAASNILCGPIEAALANGVLAHADETDDSWPGGWHPGCSIVPAALATGEQFGISGTHFVPPENLRLSSVRPERRSFLRQKNHCKPGAARLPPSGDRRGSGGAADFLSARP